MDFNDIIAWVEGLFSDLASYLLQLLQWIWNNLVAIANFLWSHLLDAFHFAWGFLKKAASLLRSLWDGFFKKIWSKVWGAIQKAQAWIESKLAPIIQFLKRMRAMYDRWFRQYIKPLMNFLQRIRNLIKILQLLHIHVLDGLDKQLAKIEGKIAQVVNTMRGIINNVIDLLNLVADPTNLIRHPQMIYSLRRCALSLFKVMTGFPPGYFIPSPRRSAPKGTGFLPNNFSANDPSWNPFASSYLGNDGLPSGFTGFVEGSPPDPSAVDDLQLLDYFDDSLYPQPACSNTEQCMKDAFDTFMQGNKIG